MIHKIHRTPQDEQSFLADGQLSELKNHTSKLENIKSAIENFHESQKDKTTETLGFTGIIQKQQEEIKVIDSLKEDINNPEKVIRKLEEVKSSILATNITLKKIEKKEFPQPKDFPKEMDVALKGISVITIKGDRGEKGDSIKGEKGDSIVGPIGPRGPKGERGKDGIGRDGKNGESIIGPKGADGLNGSPDTPDEIINKLNISQLFIDIERIRGLSEFIHSMEESIRYPLGGGSSSGRIIVETPPETPDSNITVFTVSKTPQWVVADGITYYSGQGYTANAGSITMTVPPTNYIRIYI